MEKLAGCAIHRRRPQNCLRKPAFSSLGIIMIIGTVICAFSQLVSGAAYSVVKLQHLYANSEGSSSANNGRGMSSEHFEMLKAHDRTRHGRLLNNIVDFNLQGTADPYIAGLYYTRIELGTPPRPYYVQIDTGSDILWVNCKPCNACPLSSGLGITLNFFDLQGSSTASPVSCIDSKCVSANQISESVCTADHYCGYSFEYGDGSGTLGYYVSDALDYNQYVNQYVTNNSASATIIFGCSYNQSGDLTKPDRAVDGIFGFGQNDLSVVSQLNSQGLAPKIFSHCLEGADHGGGILVLGEITEPGMVYTPIVPSQPHYNLNLQGIAVNGQQLSIDPQVFATTNTRGTIVDCGTTLAYLVEEAYDPFINMIVATVSQSTPSFMLRGSTCFSTANSVDEIFPSVTLYFEGAAMQLKPTDYLIQQIQSDTSPIWCIGWQKSGQQAKDSSKMTILGDLVLKDKVFVYDLEKQRIGWTSFDCSTTVNVSTASGESKSIDSAKLNSNGSPPSGILKDLAINLCYCFLFFIYSIL